jgi:hypothetical protein
MGGLSIGVGGGMRAMGGGGGGEGDMKKAVYDKDNNGVVDDSEKLGGVSAADYDRVYLATEVDGGYSLVGYSELPEEQRDEIELKDLVLFLNNREQIRFDTRNSWHVMLVGSGQAMDKESGEMAPVDVTITIEPEPTSGEIKADVELMLHSAQGDISRSGRVTLFNEQGWSAFGAIQIGGSGGLITEARVEVVNVDLGFMRIASMSDTQSLTYDDAAGAIFLAHRVTWKRVGNRELYEGLEGKADKVVTPHIDWDPTDFHIPAGRTLRFDTTKTPEIISPYSERTIAMFAIVNGNPDLMFGFFSNNGGRPTLLGMFHINDDQTAFVPDVLLYDGANWLSADYELRYGITGDFNETIGTNVVLSGFDLATDISVVDEPVKNLSDVAREVRQKQNRLMAGYGMRIDETDPLHPVVSVDNAHPEVGQSVLDVSEMLHIPTAADVSAWMLKGANDNKDLIKLHGFDNSGGSNELVITPELGFGPHYTAQLAQPYMDGGGVVQTAIVQLNQEEGETAGSIIIPAACNSFDVSYYRAKAGGLGSSYYKLFDNTLHPFSLQDTPMANLMNIGYMGFYLINGVSVSSGYITSIVLGRSYNPVTTIGNKFLQYLTYAQSISLQGLSSVTQIGNYFLYRSPNLIEIDLSGFVNLSSIGDRFIHECPRLRKIRIGSIDWSFQGNIQLPYDPYAFYPNPDTSDCMIYADTIELGNAFKNRFNTLRNWTVAVG